MPSQAELLALADAHFVKNYRQQPIVLARGKGSEVWDVAGQRYLDMTAGIAVCGLGHAHPAFTAAVSEQLGTLVHVSNLYFNEQQILAAANIAKHAAPVMGPNTRVMFCNSGGEANEAAVKLVRRYQHVVAGAPERTKIVSTHASFHGRTIATVSLTGQPKYRDGFGPLFGPVEFIDYGNLEQAAKALEGACAIIVEPIQAEGGIIVAPPGYLKGLRELCDKLGALLVFDEVQTGMGRTGKWFGHQWDGVAPDVMSLAKGLGGGIPVGAIVATEKAAEGLAAKVGGAVPHASTFGGNPLASAAANAVFAVIEKEGLLAKVVERGEYLAGKLAKLVEEFPGHAIDVRGRGLLRGLSVSGSPVNVVGKARERGCLLSVAGDKVVRFAPAYTVEPAQLDEAVSILRGVLADGVGK